jgi:hypothetical protein
VIKYEKIIRVAILMAMHSSRTLPGISTSLNGKLPCPLEKEEC